MKKLLVSSICLLSVCGCAVGGHIAQIDMNRYTLTEVDMKLGFGPVRGGVVSDVYSQANAHCSNLDKKVKRLSHSQKDAAVGSPASFTLEFSCVNSDEL